MERVDHPRKTATGTKSRLHGRVIRPDFIEAMIQTVAATRRVSRMIRTGRCVVPPLISGAKTARPPMRRMGRRLTGNDPWDGMGARYSAQQPLESAYANEGPFSGPPPQGESLYLKFF